MWLEYYGNSSVPPAALLWGDIWYPLGTPMPFKFGVLQITSPDFGQESGKKHGLEMGTPWDVLPWGSLFAQDHPVHP